MVSAIRKSGVKQVPLSEIKDDLSRFLREAETQEIVITRHGKPAGVLIGFESEEDWFEYRLEHDPRFLRRIEQARNSLRAGRPQSLSAAAPIVFEEAMELAAGRVEGTLLLLGRAVGDQRSTFDTQGGKHDLRDRPLP